MIFDFYNQLTNLSGKENKMTIIDFLIKNYILFIMLVGMFIITLFDVYLDRSMIIKLRIVLGLIFALSVFC